MDRQLSVESAKQLIEFISKTNYQIAAEGDGIFDSKEEALLFVESEDYDPEEPLNVCFDTLQGDYNDSVSASFDGEIWEVEDFAMGGFYAYGKTLEEALRAFRAKYDPTDDYCPIELMINQ